MVSAFILRKLICFIPYASFNFTGKHGVPMKPSSSTVEQRSKEAVHKCLILTAPGPRTLVDLQVIYNILLSVDVCAREFVPT